jgi:peptidyl-prolyl cis-trans isomerase D
VGGGAFINNPELESVVFGDAVLNQRRIGGPVPVGEDRFVLVKALEHRKPVVPPLAEVRARVLEAVTRELAAAAALNAAQSVAKIVGTGASFEQMTKGLGLKVEAARFIDRRDPAVPAALRESAFAMPRPKAGKAELRALALPEGGAAVVMLSASRVMPAAGDAAVRQARAQQISGRQGQGAVSAYVEDLREKAKVKTNELAFQ